jgi:hypothetical protein
MTGMEHHSPSSRERVIEMARRRRRNRFVKSLAVFLLVSGGFTVFVVLGWGRFKNTGIFETITGGDSSGSSGGGRNSGIMYEGGFHVVDETYWVIFEQGDDTAAVSRPPPKTPTDRPGPASHSKDPVPPPPRRSDDVKAEGLTVRKMKSTGPYTVNGDMGGLIAARVGVWKSPNKLGNGPIAFYCEHLEEVEVTHWAKNFLGFRVYRILKQGRSGWVLGANLMTEDGTPFK